MTCIVGLRSAGEVYIGADSAGVAGLSLAIRKDRKVFRSGEAVIGFSSSFRMGQLLQYSLTIPSQKQGQSVWSFMVNDVIGAVRSCLRDGGYMTVSDGVDTGGFFLIGYRGQLFEIESDFQVNEPASGLSAIGCGGDIALGSLHTTRTMDMLPAHRALAALSAAEVYSAGVAGPFFIASTKHEVEPLPAPSFDQVSEPHGHA